MQIKILSVSPYRSMHFAKPEYKQSNGSLFNVKWDFLFVILHVDVFLLKKSRSTYKWAHVKYNPVKFAMNRPNQNSHQIVLNIECQMRCESLAIVSFGRDHH